MVVQNVTYRGFSRKHPRHTLGTQEKALRERGAAVVFVADEHRDLTRENFLKALRKGDTLVIWRLFLLAEPRKKTRDNPRQDLWSVLADLRKRNVTVLEAATGRVSSDQAQRDAMLAEAIEMLTYGGRGHSVTAKINGSKGGRPSVQFTPDETKKAEAAWFDVRYERNEDAAKHFPEGFTVARAYKQFGPSGRPFI